MTNHEKFIERCKLRMRLREIESYPILIIDEEKGRQVVAEIYKKLEKLK